MAREMLWIDGVSQEQKEALKKAANELFGKPNASLMVRHLIANHLTKPQPKQAALSSEDAQEVERVEIRLPRKALATIDALAESRFSKRNFYLVSVILAHLKVPQMQPDEIEVLRRSNYELAKIGTNINQIAKAFNSLLKMGGQERMPEVGKKMASLRAEIKAHTNKVLRVLNAGTTVWETQSGRAQANKPKRREAK